MIILIIFAYALYAIYKTNKRAAIGSSITTEPSTNNSQTTHSSNYHTSTFKTVGAMSAKDEKFLSQLYECVNQNYQNNKFGIKQITQQLCLTEKPLQKKLKSALGITLNKYIKIYRLEKAAELLQEYNNEGTKPIYEAVGFSSQAYFITCFKAHFGVTPKYYTATLQTSKRDTREPNPNLNNRNNSLKAGF